MNECYGTILAVNKVFMCVFPYAFFSRDSVAHGSNPNATSASRLLFRFLTLLLLRCTASPTPRRFGRCLRRTLGSAAAVTPTTFWRFLLAFCLAELHQISELSSILLPRDDVLCSEAAPAQADLLCI